MRVIRTEIPSIEVLKLPKVIHDIALARRGLTLVTGTTGSGKSTTLASMIDLINTNYRTKIITVEDPVEYLHANKKSPGDPDRGGFGYDILRPGAATGPAAGPRRHPRGRTPRC